MSNQFFKECIDGGDSGVWGLKELRQNRPSLGINTCRLYDNAGTLEMTTGIIGIDYGSNRGVTLFDTLTTPIDISGIANSRWFYIELSISGSTPSIIATDTGDSSYWTLPAVFTGAYDRAKAGYYINASKRCIGMGWKNSTGVLKGVVNVGSIDDHYAGYSTCPTTAHIYRFEKNIDSTFDTKYVGKYYAIPESSKPATYQLTGGTQVNFTDVDFSPYVPYGVKAIKVLVMVTMLGDGTTDQVFAMMRQKGSSATDYHKVELIQIDFTNLTNAITISQFCDKDILCSLAGVTEYKVSSATLCTLSLQIKGYYIP
jgi:hypothetical protein